MKKFDYIVIQAPMISELGLKGNSLLLFAMIHGFSKDGVNRYRASLKDMCEWLCTSKSAISPTLNALVDAGYINKHDVLENGTSKPEYTTNYERLLAKAAAEGALKPTLVYKEKPAKGKGVRNPYPSQKAVKPRGTESVLGTESRTEAVRNLERGGTESVPNKYNINIYKYYSCCYGLLSEQQQKQEQQQFFKIFFFRGAADPAAEVKRFVAHNQVNGWQNKAGKVYDNTEKRMALAELWTFTTGERGASEFLAFWERVFNHVAGVEGAMILLDMSAKLVKNDELMLIHCKRETAAFLEKNIDKVKELFVVEAAGRKIKYVYTNQK